MEWLQSPEMTIEVTHTTQLPSRYRRDDDMAVDCRM